MLLNLLNTYENFRYAIDELPNLETLKIKILKEFEMRKQEHNDESGTMAIEHERKNKKRRKNHKHENNMNIKKVISKMFPLWQATAFECYVKREYANRSRASSMQEIFYLDSVEIDNAYGDDNANETNNEYTIIMDSVHGGT